MLQLIATIASPVALVTALLFYFGWVRTTVQANELGFDPSILNLSTTDYVLGNINVLFFPLMLLVIVSLGLHWLHQRLIGRSISRSRRTLVLRLAQLLRSSWILWVVLGIVMVSVLPAAIGRFVLPLSITLALLCAGYGRALHKRITGVELWSRTMKTLVIVLVAFMVFWDTERIARIMGEGYAAQIAAQPQQLAAVTVFSAKSLEIRAAGVVETKLGRPDSEYLYRYNGLRLLRRSGERYILINERWDAQQGRVIVLREAEGIRMEFRR